MQKYNKIIINGRFLTQNITGVQRYAIEITKAIDASIFDTKKNWEIAVPCNINPNVIPPLKNIKIIRLGKTDGILWEQLDFARYLKKSNGLGICLCNTVPILTPKCICCIHDLTYKLNPQFVVTKHLILVRLWHLFQYKIVSKKACHLFTVSEFSKKQLMHTYKLKSDFITVAYNAWQHYSTDSSAIKLKDKFPFLEEKKYFFSMSTLAKNKNFPWLIKAAKINPSYKFAVAGNLDVKKMGNTLGSDIPSNFVKLGYITDDEAKLLMKHCKGFIFPSFYEGFGIPPLEALAMGAEVICSNTSCLPEIFKNSVHYIDPYTLPPDLDSVLSTKTETAESILNLYSWQKSAEKYIQVITNIYNG